MLGHCTAGQLQQLYSAQAPSATQSPKDHFCEVLSRTIQKVQSISKSQGTDIPMHLVVVADNTVAQAKNQFVLKFLAWLVAMGHFTSAVLFHLMEGHTHEDQVT